MPAGTPPKMNLLIPQTPSRDRTVHTPASQFSSPVMLRTTTSSATLSPNPAASSAPSPSPVSISAESLLNIHAAASNPYEPALEAAVSDRNTLASQNTQLWKLIEKQRTGYSQLLKELERVRGERDAYKSKLHALGENTDALLKAHREKEKREGRETLRSVASHSHLRPSDNAGLSSSTSSLDPRQHLVRTQSDENSSRHRHLTHSHSRDTVNQSPRRERQGSQSSLNVPPSHSSTYLNPSQASSTSNLSSPSVSPSATSSNTNLPLVGSENTPRKPSPLQNIPIRAGSLPPSLNVNGSATSTPQTATSAAPQSAFPHSAAEIPPPKPPPTVLTPPTPATAVPIDTYSQSRDASSHSHSQSLASSSSSSISSSQSGMRSDSTETDLTVPTRPHALSRESRISLPEEAKRYYATMSESPFPSPRTGYGFNASGPSGSPKTAAFTDKPMDSPPPITVHDSTGTVRDVEFNQPPSVAVNGTRRSDDSTRGEFLDLEDGDSAYDGMSDREAPSSTLIESPDPEADDDPDGAMDAHVPRANGKARVEDFPLPPTTPPVVPGAGDVLTTAQLQAMAAAQKAQKSDDGASTYSGLQPSQQQQQPPTPGSPFPLPLSHPGEPQISFRTLPLLATDLPHTTINVSHSSIKPNDRGKEVLSFTIVVDPGHGKQSWRIEKLFSDVLNLDTRVRSTLGKNLAKKLVTLPEGKLWRDHAPAKVDQRKDALEQYLKSLIALPVKNKDEIVAFFTSDIVREAAQPVSQAGYKEGYLTKRGKNFGGWKTRYFVLNGPTLEYYESRGGTHLGSIMITGAQIGRQQKSTDRQQSDEDNDYRHAFLIIEAKRGPGGSNPRHVLCAQSDAERDSWVEELVRYVTGTYNGEEAPMFQGQGNLPQQQAQPTASGRASTSSASDTHGTPTRRPRKDDIAKGPAVPISQLPPDPSNAKLFQAAPLPGTEPSTGESSPTKTSAPSSYAEHKLSGGETPLSTSLPTQSPLAGNEDVDVLVSVSQRANSELGHYPDLLEPGKGKQGRLSPEQHRRKDKRKSINPLKHAPIPERDPSPEKEFDPHTPRVDAHGKVKISGPMNGTPIPAGYKFGKDATPEPAPVNDRREKAKSRMFWGFGRQQSDKPNVPAAIPRAVFGVSLEESLDVAQIAGLPAIVFRCIQYLEAKKADQEEGIYRLSGSSAVIKALKDRFNAEGDVDLLAPDEYWDPHAIAGLLKSFLRDLPASILTRDLHLRFLSVMDFVDPQERIKELSRLIASLPVANYSLLRALTAHLILIVQNANVNKMTMRNVGIVFSPTLGIPAGVFSLMLGEFTRVFNVDGNLDAETATEPTEDESMTAEMSRRNSKHYSDAAADAMLGLSGRALKASEDAQSDDGDQISLPDDSGTEETADVDSTVESSAASSTLHVPQQQGDHLSANNHTQSNASSSIRSHASSVAASRGLNINVSDKASRRQSRVVGLPHSPRPHPQPSPSPRTPHTPQGNPQQTSAAPVSPLQTPR
ncbi:RhoGAP-domain-containing protein [Panus rudis PR-1116 ss-1]|nr:RhoGAP-domain-containing protein [Panus rudis PR-1116 ss-1]